MLHIQMVTNSWAVQSRSPGASSVLAESVRCIQILQHLGSTFVCLMRSLRCQRTILSPAFTEKIHVLLESTSAFSLPSSVLSGPHAPLLNRAMDMREGQIPMFDSALLSPAVLLTCYHFTLTNLEFAGIRLGDSSIRSYQVNIIFREIPMYLSAPLKKGASQRAVKFLPTHVYEKMNNGVNGAPSRDKVNFYQTCTTNLTSQSS